MSDKRLAIESHTQTAFKDSVSEDLDNRRSRVYRLSGSPYGFMLHFQDFIFYLELIQHGIGCDRALLNHKYPIAYIDPTQDRYGRQSIKPLANRCPITIDSDILERAIALYIKTIKFRSICDSFKLTTSVAILSSGEIITGKSAYRIYTQTKTRYHDVDVILSWIPYKDRPSEMYKDRRDNKCYVYEDKPVKKFKLSGNR